MQELDLERFVYISIYNQKKIIKNIKEFYREILGTNKNKLLILFLPQVKVNKNKI